MSNDKNIRLFLITGFLGAGKTTLLGRIIDHLQAAGQKLGILMNEFGQISVDGPLLRKHGVDIVEINNGSVFCSCLKGSFIEALIAYSELPIDYLLVETSGMADPSSIEAILDNVIGKAAGKSYAYGGAICLIDAAAFLDQVEILAALERQVAASDLLIVNKTDLADEATLAVIDEKVRSLNRQAAIRHCQRGEIDLDFLASGLKSGGRPVAENGQSINSPFNRPTAHIVTARGVYDRPRFEEFLRAVMPVALRMKGFFLLDEGWRQIDVVGRQIEIRPSDIPRDISELVVISDQGFAALTVIYGQWDKRFPAQKMTVK
ncbi:MAG: GTP-binding protein [Desulfobulbaceae bacterium]|jgi:G3E family GTPase|nr:GTP-binding protein [Desulfobulbaceae bacterium]